jgi:two-component system LytT family sensor kinase
MTTSIWPIRDFAAKQAIALTLAFWAFVFVVFQAPALKNGGVTLWETTGYLAVVGTGAALSLAVYAVVRLAGSFRLGAKVALVGAAAMVAALLHSAIDPLIFVASADAFAMTPPLPPLLDAFAFNILIYVWIYGLYATALGLVFASLAMRDQERRLAAATAAAQEAQLAALRFQINPHFLFNTLNAVTSLIGSGRNIEAETVVVRLAEFFRASLTRGANDLVALDEELDLVGSYLDIEAARFGERLVVDIDFPDHLRQAKVPHFLLQPLTENAVKHGVARAKHPVTVKVRATERDGALTLTVSDNGGGAGSQEPAANGAGVGLANVAARLRALFGDGAALRTVTEGELFLAVIEMPLLLDAKSKQAAA